VNREEHLDRLIEQQFHGASAPLPANDEDAALLAAAAALVQACLRLGIAASNSLPGDPLYG
jgi:hypothetical protein